MHRINYLCASIDIFWATQISMFQVFSIDIKPSLIKFYSKAAQRAKPRSKSINFNVYANSNVLILHVLKTLVIVNNLKEAYSTN